MFWGHYDMFKYLVEIGVDVYQLMSLDPKSDIDLYHNKDTLMQIQ